MESEVARDFQVRLSAVEGAVAFTPQDVEAMEELVGFVPFVGIPADFDMARKEFGRGEYGWGTVSLIGAFPVAGDVIKGTLKSADKGVDAIRGLKKAGDVAGAGDLLGKGTKQGARALRKTRGWQVGDDITNLTRQGTVPKWPAVRQRHWKNRVHYAKPGEFSEANLARMRQGKAPQHLNPKTGRMESVELHHDPAQRHGGLFDFTEVSPQEHARTDPFRKLGD